MRYNKFFDDSNSESILFIDDSEKNMDLYYLTKFFAPDPFILILTRDQSTIIVSDLEYERAKKEAAVDNVLRVKDYLGDKNRFSSTVPGSIRAVISFLSEKQVSSIRVSGAFPVRYADLLRDNGFTLSYTDKPIVTQRSVKTAEEIAHIETAVHNTEIVVSEAIGLIAKSKNLDGVLHLNDAPLTSEKIKSFIMNRLIDRGYLAMHTIVACGEQACDPHNQGTGYLYADKAIILDVFPRSMDNFYFADMTRTVVKGRPSDELVKIYEAVEQAQQSSADKVAPGIKIKDVHQACCDVFDQQGYKTGLIDGSMQGFIHSTGHGVGLDIHEEPKIYNLDEPLESGNVITIEPGLYYKKHGGVRIEDIVVVDQSGGRNLNHLEKQFIL